MKNQNILNEMILLLLLVLTFSVNGSSLDSTKSKTVLIAKSNSWIENKVTAILTDSLVKIGYRVTILDIKSISGENAGDYFVTIVFDGIKAAKFIEPVYKYSTEAKVKNVNFFVFRITGDIHDESAKIDAFTAATKTIKPQAVADKIIGTVLKVSSQTSK